MAFPFSNIITFPILNHSVKRQVVKWTDMFWLSAYKFYNKLLNSLLLLNCTYFESYQPVICNCCDRRNTTFIYILWCQSNMHCALIVGSLVQTCTLMELKDVLFVFLYYWTEGCLLRLLVLLNWRVSCSSPCTIELKDVLFVFLYYWTKGCPVRLLVLLN